MSDAALARVLVESGLLPRGRVDTARERAAASGVRLDTAILLEGWLGEASLLEALGRALKSRVASAADLAHVPPSVLRLVPPRVAARFRVVPFRLEGRTLRVASLDPTDLLVEDELRILTGCTISSFAALEARLLGALEEAYGVTAPTVIQGLLARLDGRAAPAGPAPRRRPAPAAPPASGTSPAPRGEPGSTTRAPERGSSHGSAPRPEAPADPEELELSGEDLELFPGLAEFAGAAGKAPPSPSPEPVDPGEGADPETRLAAASEALGRAEMREDIADALLAFCRPDFRRRALFIVRREAIVGWRGEGEGVVPEVLRAVEIPTAEPSVFHPLLHGTDFWLGPLAPMPRNTEVALGLGGTPAGGCFVHPIRLKGRVVAFLWGDNLDGPVHGAPLPQLRRLAAKAGLAFEAYVLRAKIRRT